MGSKYTITPHYFRAACAVHLLERGVDIRQVQEIIGWKSLSVVQNYTRVTPQRQAQLKEQHHPGFSPKTLDKEEKSPQTPDDYSSSEANQIEFFRKEIEELKKTFQEEQRTRAAERQVYEQRIDELLKSQQELNQRIIQLLTQSSSQ
ncbi:MAG: tyrosine-type recombinase/integrase [Candidatus Hodarchaeota archaeon]